uniref:Ig-like domain-containing protein n=1 Tax=Variovorax sp. YR752 TaxID=1884383 RepID=UPI003137E068
NILIADALSVQGPFLDFAVAKGTDSFAFDLAFGLNDAFKMTVYDTAGNVLETVTLNDGSGSDVMDYKSVVVSAPAGKLIGRVALEAMGPGVGIYMDNFQIGGGATANLDAKAVIIDPAGNISSETMPMVNATLDKVMDDQGTIRGELQAGALTDDTQPDLSGKAGANSTVVIKDNGVEIGRTTADANGNWALTPLTPLANGAHSLTVTALDAHGIAGTPSGAFGLTVDATAPAKPTLVSVTDDVGSITGNVALNGTTDDARPTFKGKAEAGSTVVIYDKGVELIRVPADASGNWTYTPASALNSSTHTITAVAIDKAGNTSAASDAFGFTVATAPPAKPTIVTVMDDVGSIRGELYSGGFTDDTKPVFKGKAEANSTVIVLDNGVEVTRVPADASGNWTYTPATALVNGGHSISAVAVNKAGTASVPSAAFGFTVDTVAPAKATIVSVADDVGTIKTPNMASGTTTDDAKPTFKGKAEANSTVVIYDKGVEIQRVQATAAGDWTFTPATALADGAHSVTVAGADKAGNLSAQSAAFGFTVDTTPPSLGAEGGMVLSYGYAWFDWWFAVSLMHNPAVKAGDFIVVKGTGGTKYFELTQADIDNAHKAPWSTTEVDGAPLQVAYADAAGNTTAFIYIDVDMQGGTWFYPSTFGSAEPVVLADDNVIDSPTHVYAGSDETLIAKLGFADRLEGGAGNDTFTNVGTGDVVHGGAGNDTVRIHSGDFERLDGGLGIDTLVMDGKSMHIDLSALGAKVQGFEKFDLGAGGNTLALSASDVLAGGARDRVMADGKVQMLVNGANGDVDLLGGHDGADGWTQGSNATVGGVTYSVYTNLAGTAELLVEDKVHVTIL